jgi:hypothetical protein
MAAPHVAAVAALMYQVFPPIKPDQVLSILQSTSSPFPKVASRQCDTRTCGAGIVNAEAAIGMTAKLAAESLSSFSTGFVARPQAAAFSANASNFVKLTLPNGSEGRLEPSTVIRLRRTIASEGPPNAKARVDWVQMMLVREPAADVAGLLQPALASLGKLTLPDGSPI